MPCCATPAVVFRREEVRVEAPRHLCHTAVEGPQALFWVGYDPGGSPLGSPRRRTSLLSLRQSTVRLQQNGEHDRELPGVTAHEVLLQYLRYGNIGLAEMFYKVGNAQVLMVCIHKYKV